MGFLDKAKRLLGLTPEDDETEEAAAPKAAPKPGAPHPRGPTAEQRGRKDRPPLPDVPAEQGQSVDDALEAREAGDKPGARKILAMIDRGGGLRTVLRAAAALEAKDDSELGPLLKTVAAEAEGYRLWLQVAAALTMGGDPPNPPPPALGDATQAAPYLEHARTRKAPEWALAWTRAVSHDDVTKRHGLVELLFVDAPLARTVAARDLAVEGAVTDSEASQRYAAFAHGRDSIRRFGARAVADLLERVA